MDLEVANTQVETRYIKESGKADTLRRLTQFMRLIGPNSITGG